MSDRTHVDAANRIYEFSPDLDPAVTVDDGAALRVETVDSLEGRVQTDDDLVSEVPSEVNGATGPIAVEGASPGDVLEVEVEAIRMAEDRGRVVTIPGFGLLQDHEAIEAPRSRVTPIDEETDTLAFGDFTVDINPVIGTIGVAPASESYTTIVPHDHGGNLDTTAITAGNSVYFPVFQEGGLLAMGDCKAAMADGEMCGTGAEVATEIDLTVRVHEPSQATLERPLIETPDQWMTVASAETLSEACKLANADLTHLLATDHGLDFTDAHLFSSLVADLRISQVVDPLLTVRNTVPKQYLTAPV